MAPRLLVASLGTNDVLPGLRDAWDAEGYDCQLDTLELPNRYDEAARLVKDKLIDQRPDLFVLLGADPTTADWILQMFAANYDDDPEPDDAGDQRSEHIIDPDGPVAYRAKLPLDGIWDKFLVERIPLRMSHKAGLHVYNHAYYTAMRTIDQHMLPTIAGAIQHPATPELAEEQGTMVTVNAEGGPRTPEQIQDELIMMLVTMRRLYVELDDASAPEHE